MSWHSILADHLDRWEGLRLTAYQDRRNGVWTVGWGHTGPEVREGLTITREQAEAWLAEDMGWAARAFDQTVTAPVNDKIKAACVSLIFNIGSRAWRRSTCLVRLNARDYAGAAEALTWWNKDQHPDTGELVVVRGLVRRREAERALFMEGVAELGMAEEGIESPVPVPRPGRAKGGEAKPMSRSKTAWGSATGLAGAAATIVQGFAYIDWRVAVPLIVVAGALGFIFINRWLEARKGEH